MRQYDVQVEIFNRLKCELDIPVYDYVETNTKLPYIIFGESESEPVLTKTTVGERIKQILYVWSNLKGKEEIFKIIEKIKNTLSGDLKIEGVFLIEQKITNIWAIQLDDNLFQGRVTLEILIDEE